MIEIKMRDLLQSSRMLDDISKKSLKGRAAFQLVRIIREIEKEYNSFQDVRRNLVEKYGVRDAQGQIVTESDGSPHVEADKIDDFNREINELLDTTVQLNADYLALEDIEDTTFTVEQMYALSEYIKNKDA